MKINCRGKLINLDYPKIAGILNITPDSFYDGGKYTYDSAILNHTEQIIVEGADFVDIGAYSSRPGAEHISEHEELDRLVAALKLIRKNFPEQIISVDTFRSKIAEIAVKDFEVDIVNDISAGEMDQLMFETVSELAVPYVMMHMRGNPQNMQLNTIYVDLLKEIIMYFAEKLSKAKSYGINDIIIDPGFGFGKSVDQNYLLLSELDKLTILDCPILVGISRKSMIYNELKSSPDDVLPATIALNTTALQKGANIIRVHDVKEAVQTVKMYSKLRDVSS